MDFYKLTRPLLFQMDPETAHQMGIKLLKSGMLPKCNAAQDPSLEQQLWGLRFPNPVGLAAGFDKNAEVIGPAMDLGFGFVEAGTVTPKPQDGNPKPRVFREANNNAVINRMGFPNVGMNAFKENIEKFLELKPRPNGVLGINIGMNKNQKDPAKDYKTLIRVLGPMADYLTVNISSPNTPGLRDLQEPETLAELIADLKEERKRSCGPVPPPILIKLAPDLDAKQRKAVAKTLVNQDVEGVILGNTTLDRPESLPAGFRDETGGLSGQPLKNKATETIKSFYKDTKGKIPIIGVGGISSGADAYEKIRAGASLVQLYTGLVFQGPSVVYSINQDLRGLLKADGFATLADAVGADHKK